MFKWFILVQKSDWIVILSTYTIQIVADFCISMDWKRSLFSTGSYTYYFSRNGRFDDDVSSIQFYIARHWLNQLRVLKLKLHEIDLKFTNIFFIWGFFFVFGFFQHIFLLLKCLIYVFNHYHNWDCKKSTTKLVWVL